MRVFLALFAGATLVSCSHLEHMGPPSKRPEPPPDVEARAPSRPLERRAKLHYEIHGRPFPLPIVHGTIAGHRTLMLIDTGASSHVIAGWFARKHSLPMKKLGDVGTDHVGRAIAAFRIDAPDMKIDDWGRLTPKTVLATEVPTVIEQLEIGAFVSPQHLDEEGDAVVVDLAKNELRSAWWKEAYEELSANSTWLIAPEQARVCAESDGPVRGLAFVVPSRIATQDAKLLVDTGAQHSDVFMGSKPGQKLSRMSKPNKEAMFTASGRIMSARKLASVPMKTGAHEVTADVDLVQGEPDAACPRDGVLGMDALKGCALLFGGERVFGSCGSGEATSRPAAP